MIKQGIPLTNERATVKLRDGSRKVVIQNKQRWINALEGHKKDAHNGKLDPKCAACKELSARAEI